VDWPANPPVVVLLVRNETTLLWEQLASIEAGCTFHCSYFSHLFLYSKDETISTTVSHLRIGDVGSLDIRILSSSSSSSSSIDQYLVIEGGNYSSTPSYPSCSTLSPSTLQIMSLNHTISINSSSSTFMVRACDNSSSSSVQSSSLITSPNYQLR